MVCHLRWHILAAGAGRIAVRPNHHRMGLTQIDLIIQIYYFIPRFLRDTINPLADGADGAERYMGLTQIDLIIQILLFSSAVSAISARYSSSSRRWRRFH